MINEAFGSLSHSYNHAYGKLCVTKIKYSMSNIQDYNVLYNNFLHLVICEDLHFTNM